MNDNARKFACVNCGHSYETYPPNDRFNIALPSQCEDGDCIEIKYDCENCNKRNSIFWDRKHSHVVVTSRGYT